MKDKTKHIELLLERFFNGETSNHEEKELYFFFGQDSVPEHLSKYKAVFNYFESGIFEEVGEIPVNHSKTKLITFKKWIVPIISIAASLLILLTINYLIDGNKNVSNRLVNGYITKNGIKIYDQKQIETEYNLIHLEIDNKRKEIEMTKEKTKKNLEEYYTTIKEMSSININHQ